MKNVLLSGLVAALAIVLVGVAAGFLFHAIIPSLAAEYQNPALFRPMSDPLMYVYFLHPLILGFGLAWLWNKTKSVWTSKSQAGRGIQFANVIWVATSLPGILITYSSFPVSLTMCLTWLASALLQLIAAGLVYAAMNK